MQKILVTDTLFIFPEHEQRLRDAGFEVERLEKPMATEDELIMALRDKAGYILGGVEKVTAKVLDNAPMLKALVFTGSDWKGFVPGYETAAKRGILIADTPGANTYAVSEYTLTLMLLMLRRMLELGRTGTETFMTAQSLTDVHIGIIGMGRIGERVCRMLKGLGVSNISYYNRTRKPELEAELQITYRSLNDVFAACDVITNHVSTQAGTFITKALLEVSKDGAIFINTGSEHAYDADALYDRLLNHKARAAFDFPMHDERFNNLPVGTWFCSNESAAYNTYAACKTASDMATESLIHMLQQGDDQYVVNR